MCGLGPFRESAGNMQPRQECLGLGRFVFSYSGSSLQRREESYLSLLFPFFSFGFTVDEEDEYECVTVVNSHTQDVKHVVWHPTQEVGHTLLYAPDWFVVTLSYHLFTMCFHSSWLQPATTTTSVFTRKRMMTGSAEPP